MNATFKILKILEKSKINSDVIFNQLPGVVLIISKEGRILRGNYNLSELLKISHDELCTKKVDILLKENELNTFLGRLDEAKPGVQVSLELNLGIEGDRERKIYSFEISFLTTFKDRQVDAFLVLGKDITEIKLMQEQLIEANSNLEEKVRQRTTDLENALNELKGLQTQAIQNAKMVSLGEMAGNVAHEINNPLTIIKHSAKSIAKNLKKNDFSNEKVDKFIGRIDETVDRMAHIISNLKGFSRDASDDPMDFYPLKDIFEESITLVHEKFHENGVDLKLNLGELESAKMFCNKVPINQVVVNILSNGYDFVKDLEEKWVEVTARRENGYYQLRIQDSGLGIPEENREKVFEPFFTTKELGAGTGLGLSIAIGIIEKQHKGKIYVDPDVKNTTFVIEIPENLEDLVDDDVKNREKSAPLLEGQKLGKKS